MKTSEYKASVVEEVNEEESENSKKWRNTE